MTTIIVKPNSKDDEEGTRDLRTHSQATGKLKKFKTVVKFQATEEV